MKRVGLERGERERDGEEGDSRMQIIRARKRIIGERKVSR